MSRESILTALALFPSVIAVSASATSPGINLRQPGNPATSPSSLNPPPTKCPYPQPVFHLQAAHASTTSNILEDLLTEVSSARNILDIITPETTALLQSNQIYIRQLGDLIQDCENVLRDANRSRIFLEGLKQARNQLLSTNEDFSQWTKIYRAINPGNESHLIPDRFVLTSSDEPEEEDIFADFHYDAWLAARQMLQET